MISRKSLWLSMALMAVILTGVGTTLALLVRHEPAFYARSDVPPGPQRNKISMQFMNRSADLIDVIRTGGNPAKSWGGKFTEEEVNSFFAEHFLISGLASKLLPEGVSEPRVAFERDRIRLGFRYETAYWSSVISVDFRLWLAKDEPNVIVMELQRLQAGSLPISAQSLLEEIAEALRRHNVQVSWFRHDGKPTAAVRFQADNGRPTAQLQQVDLVPGVVSIVGQFNGQEPAPVGGRAGS